MDTALEPRPNAAVAASFRTLGSVPVWLTLWAVATSAAWLLPNHYYPWVTFHTDAWLGASFLVGGGCLLVTSKGRLPWHPVTALAFALACVPPLQYAFGLLAFAGQAWIASVYLLGFALSTLVGAHAQEQRPDTALDALFLAIGIAAIVSVGIQLYQWLSLSGADLWIMPLPPEPSPRPFGNLIQPNMLATFLLWGAIAVAWAVATRRVRPALGLLAAVFLLTGLALTQSRTGIASAFLLYVLVCCWRKLWPEPRRVLVAATGLLLYFVAALLLIDPVSRLLLQDNSFDPVKRMAATDIRLPVFRMFVDAAMARPWFGYGWTSVAQAQFAVAEHHPAFNGIFQHSHNLFLDLVLWLGIPLGLAVGGALVYWFARFVAAVRTARDALLVMFLAAFGVHAMLELPHQCAYMLLPAGLVLGALHVRLQTPGLWRSALATAVALWAAAALTFSLVVRDYLLIEADFQALRFEKAYNMKPPAVPPAVVLLTQLREFVDLGRSSVTQDMTAEQLERLRLGVNAFPSPANLYLYTAALAMNGHAQEARLQMRKMSRIMEPGAYDRMGRVWRSQAERSAVLGRTEWLPLEEALGRPAR